MSNTYINLVEHTVQLQSVYGEKKKEGIISQTQWSFSIICKLCHCCSSVAQLCMTVCNTMECKTPGLQSSFTVNLEPKKVKSVTASTLFPIYLPWSDGTGCHDLSFLNVEFYANFFTLLFHSHQEAPSDQIRSVAQSCLTFYDTMNCSTPGLPVHHKLPEFTQTHVHRVSDTIQPCHPLSSPSPPAPNPS